MKRSLLTALLLALLLSSCGWSAQQEGSGRESWLEQARLDARETPEELYQAALLEDTLILYTTTTRIYDTKEAFEKVYPGLTVEIHHIRAPDLVVMLREQLSQGESICDLLICTDTNAVLSSEFVPQGYLYKYVPYDIEPAVIPPHNGVLLDFMVEGAQIFYNSEAYSSPPLSNWWELTDPRFRGRLYMVDPLRSHTTSALMSSMIQHSDEMAEAYRLWSGQELVVPEGSSAGWEFWRMLLDNEVRFTSSSEEAIEFVGTPGLDDPPLAIMVSSKARKTEIGYRIAPIYDVLPAPGVSVPNTISVVGGAKNIQTAKLFIRFLLGEADGSGQGYKPYLQEGCWPVRDDVKSDATRQLEETGFWTLDNLYYAENIKQITAQWQMLRERIGEGAADE